MFKLKTKTQICIVEVPNNETTGKACREARRKHGLTLTQLAETSGYSVSYLSALERGKGVWSEFLVKAINQAIETTKQLSRE